MNYRHTIASSSLFFSSCVLTLILGLFCYSSNWQTTSGNSQNGVIAVGCIIPILIIAALVEARQSSKEDGKLFPLIASGGIIAVMFNVIMFFSWGSLFLGLLERLF